MKRLASFLILYFASFNAIASSDIVAVVNNKPITTYDLSERKKMIRAVSNIEKLTPELEKQLTKAALNSLIEEEILFDHAKTIKAKISEQEIEGAIANIEEKNKVPPGYLVQFMKSKNVNMNSFRSQIKAELIKMNIMNSFARNINVTPKEINSIVLTENQRDVSIEAVIFSSKDNTNSSFSKMQALQKKIKNCSPIKEGLYSKFATKETQVRNLSEFDSQLQTMIKDLPVSKSSNVIASDGVFKFVMVCKKDIKFLDEKENDMVVNFLTNRKISQQAKRFFANLHKKASIKILLN